MNHANKNLYQIGEVTKMLGVTRRMLLNYEDLGLLTPAHKNESSGFRYYSADNIVHIRIIKVLQGLGLSLSEINKYFNNTEKLEDVIERMTALHSPASAASVPDIRTGDPFYHSSLIHCILSGVQRL